MIVFILIALLVLCFWRIRFLKFNHDYISKKGTTAIKGIFAIIILCSHMGGYLTVGNSIADNAYRSIIQFLGQAMVAPFIFYSGYGIFHSFRTKSNYHSDFIKLRIFRILYHFDLAILLYIVVQLIVSIHYPIKNYIFCWIGLTSIGNSNWFVFVILALYSIAYLGMLVERRRKNSLIWVVLILSVLLWIFLRVIIHKPAWWVDTIACFPLGMAFRSLRTKAESLNWLFVAVSAFVLFIVWHHFNGVDVYGVTGCLFCLLLVWLTMKVKIDNPILSFLGRNAFSIYILQRLPMQVMSHYGINSEPLLFIPLSVVFTLIIAEAFTRLTGKLDLLLFKA